MKLSVLCLCLAAEALAYDASSVFRRDLATITGVLDNVKTSMEKLREAVNNNNGFADPEPLLLASNGLISSLKTGAVTINGTSNIDFLDSVRLIRPVHELTALGETLAGNLKQMRGGMKAAGLCDVARLQISSISTKSQDLINAVDSKIPTEAQEISRELTSGLTSILAQSKDQFSEQNCKEANQEAKSSKSASLLDGCSIAATATCCIVSLALIMTS
ncbi:hypothetical protein E4U42_000672 [Claviceps africana]|uniref:Uncharacterized protein n=1 Tax=Claviceps africana TaxID=83212 RepID=A0A8K0J2A6_9HYPO|nr:hypothetical protein E4U42_000672 [Claviceps africana]